MRHLTLFLFLFSALWAKSYLASNIAVPKNRVMDIEVEQCGDACLQQYLDQGMIFSFLANSDEQMVDKKLKEAKMIFASYFNLEKSLHESLFRVALLIPDKIIGNYAVTTNNAVFAYLIAKNKSFDLQAYYIENENEDTINEALEQIKADGFSYVIAPLTLEGAKEIAKAKLPLNIYFPTIHKSDLKDPPSTLFFGGIDYDAQIEKLLKYSQGYMALFYDPSELGKRLNSVVEDSVDQKWIRFATPISRKRSNLKNFLRHDDLLQNGTIFVNTSTVRSGIVMSQLTLYDVQPAVILSTQINYSPLILSITQQQDRENMYIANSIEDHNNIFIEANRLLDNDIVYDRINYATMVGIDYFLSTVSGEKREYQERVEANQVIYPITIYRPTLHGFAKVD